MKILWIVVFLFGTVMLAQEKEDDSTKIYVGKEVVVTATRTRIPIADSPSPVSVITRTTIESMNGQTVADVLRSSGGLFLKDYGSSGALKTLAIRGTSSEQSLVLVNGIRFSSMQNGLADLGLLTLIDVDRIEVVRGGSSAFYGADALGGVVNIILRQPTAPLSVGLEAASGSFDYQSFRIQAEGRVESAGILGGFGQERGKDNFPFTLRSSFAGVQSAERQNSDFSKRYAFIHGHALVGAVSSVNLSVQHSRAERGVPGPISFPSDAARQNDEDVNATASYRTVLAEGSEFSLRSGFHYNLQTFDDPNPFFPISSVYKNTSLHVNPQYEARVWPVYRFIVGAEFGQGNLHGNDFDSPITRVQKSLYWSNELAFDIANDTFDRVNLYASFRYDDISDVDHAWTPKLGFNIRLWKRGEFRLRGSYGKSFRAPTFNDMYYRGFSNPLLKPERSTSYDAGVTSTVHAGGVHSFELTHFSMDTENRIIFDPAVFLPVNIGRAMVSGFEFRYTGNWLDDDITTEFNYTLNDARKKNKSSDSDSTFDKRLPYIPGSVANVILNIRLNPFTFNASYNFVGERFTTEDNSKTLPRYDVVNANVVVRLSESTPAVALKIEVNNAFNREYEIFQDYPMPGRFYRLNLSVSK
jgi:outer membrane cobalamin receptor